MKFPDPEIGRNEAMELLELESSEYAKEQVILNNLGIVGNTLKSVGISPYDDDMFQIGLIGLLKATNSFKKEKGVAFCTYASTVVRNEIFMEFRKKKPIPTVSIDDQVLFENGDSAPISEVIWNGYDMEDDVVTRLDSERVFANLNETEKKIVLLSKQGMTQREIAGECGISQSYVSRIMKSVRRKFCE